jgi:hypothetical protein
MKETCINATVELQRQVSDGLHKKVETCEYGITPGLRGAQTAHLIVVTCSQRVDTGTEQHEAGIGGRG